MLDNLLIFIAGALFGGLAVFLVQHFRQTQRAANAKANGNQAPLFEEATDESADSHIDPESGRLGDLHAQHMEAAARIRDQRAASRAAREAKRIAAEEEARHEAERMAAEEAVLREAQRIAAEEVTRRDALRIAAEEEMRLQALRIAADEETILEAQRLAEAAEAAAQLEAQRIAAQEKATREAQRLATVDDARREVQRLAAEEKSRQEAQRIADEEKAPIEAEAEAQAETAREAQRTADEAEAAHQEQQAAIEQEISVHAESAATPVVAKLPSEAVVMIVDDSKVGRIKTNRFLVNNQFQTQLAEDGCDALENINADMPDIVITDVEMPNMDGFELTKQIRSNPATAHIPIIIISGNNDGYAERSKEVGADLILGKPYSEEDMVAQLQQFLRNGRPIISA